MVVLIKQEQALDASETLTMSLGGVIHDWLQSSYIENRQNEPLRILKFSSNFIIDFISSSNEKKKIWGE